MSDNIAQLPHISQLLNQYQRLRQSVVNHSQSLNHNQLAAINHRVGEVHDTIYYLIDQIRELTDQIEQHQINRSEKSFLEKIAPLIFLLQTQTQNN